MTVDLLALAAWNIAQRRSRAHYNAMPISTNRSQHTPCNRCGCPTRETKGTCPTCRKKKP